MIRPRKLVGSEKKKIDEAFLFSYPLTDAEKPHSGLLYKAAL